MSDLLEYRLIYGYKLRYVAVVVTLSVTVLDISSAAGNRLVDDWQLFLEEQVDMHSF